MTFSPSQKAAAAATATQRQRVTECAFCCKTIIMLEIINGFDGKTERWGRREHKRDRGGQSIGMRLWMNFWRYGTNCIILCVRIKIRIRVILPIDSMNVTFRTVRKMIKMRTNFELKADIGLIFFGRRQNLRWRTHRDAQAYLCVLYENCSHLHMLHVNWIVVFFNECYRMH